MKKTRSLEIEQKSDLPLRYTLQRRHVGRVADIVEFPDGTCVTRWRGNFPHTSVYSSMSELKAAAISIDEDREPLEHVRPVDVEEGLPLQRDKLIAARAWLEDAIGDVEEDKAGVDLLDIINEILS